MISQKFEELICQGKAYHKLLNIGGSVFNHKVGRGENCVIESIMVQPVQQNFTSELVEFAEINDEIKSLVENHEIFTLTAYDEEQKQQFTFKNKWDIKIIPITVGTQFLYNVSVTSKIQFIKDVFWLFNSTNIQIEISQIAKQHDTVTNVLGDAPNRSKRQNPDGFTDPLRVLIEGSTSAYKPMGRESANTGTGIVYNEFIVPSQGDGDTGNIIPGANGSNALNTFRQPIINVGLIEF